MRGHGRSGKPEADEAWVSQRLAEDFDAVVNGFKLTKPFVAGWFVSLLLSMFQVI
jgi:pimeloyl-ACP methyl ester carboxylesterase